MIPFSGTGFFYVMGVLLIPAVVLGLAGKQIKHFYGLFFTVAMLGFVFFQNGQLLKLLIFYVWQTSLCFAFFRLKKKSKWKSRLAVFLALCPLAAVKICELIPSNNIVQLLGVSYMTFRAMQIILDVGDGKIKELRLFDFSYFLLFFPSVASGPIDRFRRFSDDLNRKISRDEYINLLRRGVWKIMFGALSAIVISGVIWSKWLAPLPAGGAPVADGFTATLSYMYGYTFFLFFNFAGYSSMAIGTAYILGITLPENFKQPFLSVDMKDFWSRWHISLSLWLRDYVYTRFVMDSLKTKRFKNKRTASYLGYLMNMLVMGAWHGLTPAFLCYGAYHGILMSVNEVLDLHWKPFRSIKQKGWTQVVCVIVTFHLFSFGLLIFSGRLF